MPYRIIIIALLLGLVACGQQDSNNNENVLMEQFHTMDKARSVEDTLKDAQEKRRDSEDEQLNP